MLSRRLIRISPASYLTSASISCTSCESRDASYRFRHPKLTKTALEYLRQRISDCENSQDGHHRIHWVAITPARMRDVENHREHQHHGPKRKCSLTPRPISEKRACK